MMIPKTPHLEVISNIPVTSMDLRERRRMPRLSLSPEQFRLSTNGKIFPVADLTSLGMAIRVLDKNDLLLFPISASVKGILNVRRERYTVEARVCHLSRNRVGCEFTLVPEEAREVLKRFADPATLGAGLKPIPASETNEVLWYHGPSGTDLLFWRDPQGQYRRFTLHVQGSYVQWDRDRNLSTGHAAPSDDPVETRGVIRFEMMVLEPDSALDPEKLKIAKTLILSSNIPQELKNWCTCQLDAQ